MKALVFDGALKLVSDYPDPRPGPGEALVRVTMAGICNTDLEITRGYMGYKGVIGHEFVGVVEECPQPALIGQRVVGEINLVCGSCPYCTGGLANHCPNRTVLGILNRDGAMANYVTLPVENLHPVPDTVIDEEAVFTEPLAAAFEIPTQVNIEPYTSILVLGDGKLGLLVAQVLAGLSRNVKAIGKNRDKLDILARRGIDTILAGVAQSECADVVVDCTGSPAGLESAMRLVKPRGIIVLKSTVAAGASLNLAPLVVNEITLIGSRCGPFAPALAALAAGSIDVRSLISGFFSIDDSLQAFQQATKKGTIKVLLTL